MRIERITPTEALRRQRGGAILVDVRESGEHAAGHAADAVCIARSALEATPQATLPDRDAEILLICQLGGRSLQAAEALDAEGYTRLASVEGGFSAWRSDGLPAVHPGTAGGNPEPDIGELDGRDPGGGGPGGGDPVSGHFDPGHFDPGHFDSPAAAVVDADFHDRYSRHLLLPGVGEAGQRRLQAARVALVGAGGLGSPAAFYLAAAGVGTLVVADDDVVERSNLQRQILHTQARVGMGKAASARIALLALNPQVKVEVCEERITADNVERFLDGADAVLDGADNFPVRYLLNDACVKLGKPLVHGAVHRFQGQVSVFDAGRQRGISPCYRCLFPQPPAREAAPNCSDAGVLGVLPGVIGMLQATEVIKLILGIGIPLTGRLLHYDALAMRFRETRLLPDTKCLVCSPGRTFTGYADYQQFCA